MLECPGWINPASAEALDREAGGVVNVLERRQNALNKISVSDRAKRHMRTTADSG